MSRSNYYDASCKVYHGPSNFTQVHKYYQGKNS